MNYDTRLRRLEDKAPGGAVPELIVHFVDRERGTVAVLDMRAQAWHRRGGSETSQEFIERIAGRSAGTVTSV